MAARGATIAPDRQSDTDTIVGFEPERAWDVIVWDDPVNLMSYVVYVFRRVFGFPTDVARKLMLQVHQEGRALVATEPRERAEMYVRQLHGYGLQSTMQRHS